MALDDKFLSSFVWITENSLIKETQGQKETRYTEQRAQ
jgi:hypothetical protein